VADDEACADGAASDGAGSRSGFFGMYAQSSWCGRTALAFGRTGSGFGGAPAGVSKDGTVQPCTPASRVLMYSRTGNEPV
jgi:hypothetical protein